MFLNLAYLLPDGYLCAWSGNQGSTHTLDYVFTRVNNELWGSSELQALQKKALILPKLLSDSSQSVASEHEPCAREISRACLWSPYHSPQAEQGGTDRGRGGAKCWALAGYSCDGNRHFCKGKDRAKGRMCNCWFSFAFWGGEEVGGLFLLLTAQGRGEPPGLSHPLGLPRNGAGLHFWQEGFCLLVCFLFFSLFPPQWCELR